MRRVCEPAGDFGHPMRARRSSARIPLEQRGDDADIEPIERGARLAP